MEIAAAAGGEATKCAFAHLEREIGYLIHFRRKTRNLQNHVTLLASARTDVQGKVERATNNNEVIRETVRTWLTDVDVLQTDVTKLIDEVGQITGWFKGWFCSRFRLGRIAHKRFADVQGLLDSRNAFGDTVSDPKPLQSIERVCADDFEDLVSREPLTNEIMKALLNDTICLVGVFGMPGIGKTKLMEALSKRVKEEKLFDEVVMVTISENPDVKAIQNNVAMELGMQLEDSENISYRARRLHDRLKQAQDKKILIVLDDLWNELNLKEVGIPKKSASKCYKIVITTRVAHVCRQMETDLDREVPVLSKHDSWTLFRKKVGDVVDSRELETIAREVVNECAGLPLAIVTLAKALRKMTVASVWADTLRRLRKSINGDLMRVVESSIKLSYDLLPNELQKRCFLFCSLFPEDFDINVKDGLFIYVVGEKLLEDGIDYFNSLEEAKGRLDSIIEDLISSSLLFRSYRVGHIKMHDVVRDVAKMIAFKDEVFKQVEASETDLMRWPEQLESCKRLSLMRTKIRRNLLPSQVEAPQLLTLILNGCKGFSELPCDFFKKMKKLKNLDLSFTEIASLPPSISCLVELRTLCLVRCYDLKTISPVEKLEKLEILDLYGSGVERLPEEMRMLTNLKRLNMLGMVHLKGISPKVISSMSQLEELYVSSFKGWETGEMGGKINANFSEVASLANLTCLEIFIPNVEWFSINPPVHWVKLKEYDICVNCSDLTNAPTVATATNSFERRLYLEISSSIPVPNEVIWLLRRTDCLWLYKCNYLESVVQLDPTGGFKDNNLKQLQVLHCSKMKYLMSSIEMEKAPENSFNSLEVLTFRDLDNLESICNGRRLLHGFLHNLRDLELTSCSRITSLMTCELLVGLQNLTSINVFGCQELKWLIDTPSTSSSSRLSILPNLRKLHIDCCDKIKYVLPVSVARHLNQLVDFSVRYCPSIEMIIANDNNKGDGDKYILPRLESLSLKELPALVSFGRAGLVFDLDSLEELYLTDCWNLKSLPWRVTQRRFKLSKQSIVNEI
ncbi:hypothetical protein AQUCO_00200186v1 [Aquilegia coerulea]|uniref:Uncharacterized protein n=1 Tax=Aquilegia coerulea TaxID=218851 RepID=A0A2G5F1W4_AQUCA|nr:hypothetical protein AQUCO_00200186v1 [Aquilegia coerulea]